MAHPEGAAGLRTPCGESPAAPLVSVLPGTSTNLSSGMRTQASLGDLVADPQNRRGGEGGEEEQEEEAKKEQEAEDEARG